MFAEEQTYSTSTMLDALTRSTELKGKKLKSNQILGSFCNISLFVQKVLVILGHTFFLKLRTA